MTDYRTRWPDLLREVAEALGDDQALRLAGTLGGQRINVPGKLGGGGVRADARDRIVTLVGEALATHLIDHHGGTLVSIPNFAARIAEERRRFVLQNADLSANKIASALGITARRVEQIRADARADARQMSLFP